MTEIEKIEFSDSGATLSIKGDTLTLTVKFPSPETAQATLNGVVAAHQRGEDVMISLSPGPGGAAQGLKPFGPMSGSPPQL